MTSGDLMLKKTKVRETEIFTAETNPRYREELAHWHKAFKVDSQRAFRAISEILKKYQPSDEQFAKAHKDQTKEFHKNISANNEIYHLHGLVADTLETIFRYEKYEHIKSGVFIAEQDLKAFKREAKKLVRANQRKLELLRRLKQPSEYYTDLLIDKLTKQTSELNDLSIQYSFPRGENLFFYSWGANDKRPLSSDSYKLLIDSPLPKKTTLLALHIGFQIAAHLGLCPASRASEITLSDLFNVFKEYKWRDAARIAYWATENTNPTAEKLASIEKSVRRFANRHPLSSISLSEPSLNVLGYE